MHGERGHVAFSDANGLLGALGAARNTKLWNERGREGGGLSGCGEDGRR